MAVKAVTTIIVRRGHHLLLQPQAEIGDARLEAETITQLRQCRQEPHRAARGTGGQLAPRGHKETRLALLVIAARITATEATEVGLRGQSEEAPSGQICRPVAPHRTVMLERGRP